MEIKNEMPEIRRENLRSWIQINCHGSQAAFVEKTGINQGELSGLLKKKSFGEKKARDLEFQANMPKFWLDSNNQDSINKEPDQNIFQKNDIADRQPPTIDKLIGLVANAIGDNLSDADKRQLILQFTELVNAPSEHEQISRIISLVLDGSKKNNPPPNQLQSTNSEG